uniref:SREBP regulating gene protein n=1 Tax=Chlorocebus sabaeus TaxID=60711 RepID=A0A0D9R967_CHLSB
GERLWIFTKLSRWLFQLHLLLQAILVHVLSSTFRQEERVRHRTLLQAQDHDQPSPWKVQVNLGSSSHPSNQCWNSVQGKRLIMDEPGCERRDLLVKDCNVHIPSVKQYCCNGCWPCSCCLQPSQQLLLEIVVFQNLFMAVEDQESCPAKCRSSSQSLIPTDWDANAKNCYGESPLELFSA